MDSKISFQRNLQVLGVSFRIHNSVTNKSFIPDLNNRNGRFGMLKRVIFKPEYECDADCTHWQEKSKHINYVSAEDIYKVRSKLTQVLCLVPVKETARIQVLITVWYQGDGIMEPFLAERINIGDSEEEALEYIKANFNTIIKVVDDCALA